MDVPCFGRQLKWLCCAFDIQELPEVIGEVHEGHEGQQSSRGESGDLFWFHNSPPNRLAWSPTNVLVYGSMTLTTFDNVSFKQVSNVPNAGTMACALQSFCKSLCFAMGKDLPTRAIHARRHPETRLGGLADSAFWNCTIYKGSGWIIVNYVRHVTANWCLICFIISYVFLHVYSVIIWCTWIPIPLLATWWNITVAQNNEIGEFEAPEPSKLLCSMVMTCYHRAVDGWWAVQWSTLT